MINIVHIVQKDDPVLRKKAKEVPVQKIKSAETKKIIATLKEALDSQDDGVAIAAPQIGVSLRIFVISGKVLDRAEHRKKKSPSEDMVFINPVITKLSKEKKMLSEGCLSVRYLYGDVSRSTKATIRAYDEQGGKLSEARPVFWLKFFSTRQITWTVFSLSTKLRTLRIFRLKNSMARFPNIIFFGTSDFSVLVLDELLAQGIRPTLIVTTPDKPQGRHLELGKPAAKIWGEEHAVPVIQPARLNDPSTTSQLQSEKGDLFIVASYGKIIPKTILEIPKHGTLNIHPSLLPEFRGPAPIQAAILADKRDTGVTIMAIDEEMDHGPIIAQEKVSLERCPLPYPELEKILAKAGAKVLTTILPKWLDGSIKPHEQNHSLATYTKKLEKKDGLIDLSADSYQNFLKICACAGTIGTYFFSKKNGKEMRVKIAAATYDGTEKKLTIDEVIPEGKKLMSYEDFRRGQSDL